MSKKKVNNSNLNQDTKMVGNSLYGQYPQHNSNGSQPRVSFKIDIWALALSILILTGACTPAVLLFKSCSNKTSKEKIQTLKHENDSLKLVIRDLSQYTK